MKKHNRDGNNSDERIRGIISVLLLIIAAYSAYIHPQSMIVVFLPTIGVIATILKK